MGSGMDIVGEPIEMAGGKASIVLGGVNLVRVLALPGGSEVESVSITKGGKTVMVPTGCGGGAGRITEDDGVER